MSDSVGIMIAEAEPHRAAVRVGDVLCFLEEALCCENGGEDMRLSLYGRRGLAGILGDCSRRMDAVIRHLEPGEDGGVWKG